MGNALGYRTVIVIPETQSQEKKDMLRLAGAELVEVPAVPYANPKQITLKVSGRLAERGGAGRERTQRRDLGQPVRQTPPIRQGHYETTGPEVFDQTEGQGRWFHLRRGQRRQRWPVLAWPLKERNAKYPDRACRSDGRSALFILYEPAN